MSYGLRYQGQYGADMNDRPYVVQILEKDYAGGFTTITLAGTPCLPNYQTDDMRAPVRGSSCTVNILNSGSLPLTTFYSVNDDQFLVKLLQGTSLLWIGYVVQDFSAELMVDYMHEISLQCNDGLGLLKDVAFNKNATVFSADAFYTRQTLDKIFHQCLANTNLELETYVFVNLWEDRMSELDSLFPQALVDCQTFISGETFMSCYEVLVRILDRFNCSLFQANGHWNIVRWDELYGLTTVHAFIYSSAWVLTGSGLLDTPFIAQPNTGGATALPTTFPENGLRREIVRPYQFDKETFNYVQPKYLLRNYDLHELGPLIRTYIDGSGNTVSEYTFTGWSGGWGTNPTQRFIRVTVDPLQNEIGRYAVAVGAVDDTVTGAPRAVSGTPFEISQGDKVKFSFSFRHSFARSGPLNIFFAVRLYDGVNERYIGNTSDFGYVAGGAPWVPAFHDAIPVHGFFYQIVSGDNTGEWHTVEMESAQAPFSGLLTCFLGQSDGTGGPFSGETQYRDIRMEYTPFINDSTKITGHIHKDEQTISSDIKNNEDITIYIDDSPRNSILGTIYLNTFTDLVQDRTATWHRAGITESKRLGQIMTTETLQWRSVPRTKLEGTFYGLVQGLVHVSMLTIFEFSYLGGTRFVFGLFELDTRRNCWRGTAWELDSSTGAVAEIYTFNYIYATQ